MAITAADVLVPVSPDMGEFARDLARGIASAVRSVEPVEVKVEAKVDRDTVRGLSNQMDDVARSSAAAATGVGAVGTASATSAGRVATLRGGVAGLASSMGAGLARAATAAQGALVGVGTGVGQLAGRVSNLAHGAMPALGAAAGAAAKSVGLLGLATAGAIGFGVKLAADLEQTHIAMTTMLGSGEAATQMITDLKEFSAKTPFELPGLVDSTRRLLAMNFQAEEILPTMTAIGDAVAALGMGQEGINRVTLALGQMQAKGKVSGEEMRQLTEAGIPAWELLAEVLGTDVNQAMDAVTKRQVDARTFIDAFVSQIGPMEKFAGAMEMQSRTLSGLFSTLKDVVQLRLADVAAPLVEGLREAMPEITTLLDETLGRIGPGIAGALATLTPALIGVLSTLLEGAAPIIETFAEVFVSVADALLPALQPILPVIGTLAAAFGQLALAFVPLIPPLANIVTLAGEELAQAIITVTPAMVTLAQIAADLLDQLTPLLGPILGLVAAFVTFSPIIGPVASAIAGFAGVTLGATFPIGALVLGIGAVIAVVVLLARRFEPLRRVTDAIGQAFSALASVVSGAVSAAFGWIADQVRLVIDIFSDPDITSDGWVGFVETVVVTVMGLWDAISGVVTRVVDLFQTAWKPLAAIVAVAVAPIVAPFVAAAGLIVGVFRRVGDDIIPFLTRLVSRVGDIFGGVFDVIGGLADILIGIFTLDPAQIMEGLRQTFGGVVDVVTGVFGQIGDTVGQAFAVVTAVFDTVGDAIAGVLGGPIGAVVDWFQGLADTVKRVVGIVASVWDFPSTASSGWIGVVEHIVGAVRTGFDFVVAAFRFVGRVASEVFDRVLKPVFARVMTVLRGVAAVFGFWKNMAELAFRLVAYGASQLWDALKPVFAWIKTNVIEGLSAGFKWFGGVVATVWDAVSSAAGAAWGWLSTNVFDPIQVAIARLELRFKVWQYKVLSYWSLLKTGLRMAWDWIDANVLVHVRAGLDRMGRGFARMRDVAVGAWNWVRDKLGQGWAWLTTNVFDPLHRLATETIPGAFRTAVTAIGSAWDGIREAFKKPVQWVLDNVWNPFARKINELAALVDMKAFVPVITLGGGGVAGAARPFATRQFHAGGMIGRDGERRDLAVKPLSAGERLIVGQVGEVVLTPQQQRAVLAGMARPHEGVFRDVEGRPIGGPFSWVRPALERAGQFANEQAAKVLGFVGNIIDPLIDRVKETIGEMAARFGRPGELVGGVANRGIDALVGWVQQRAEAAKGKVQETALGGGGPLGGAVGWQRMWAAVRAAFPNARLFSALRPGAVTVTGRQSYHALGRAIDITPSMAIANWIAQNYGAQTRELIYSPMGARQIRNGRPHYYSGAVRAMHFCVPLDVEILTRRGWLPHDQVQVGDETPGYNWDTGRTEWTKVTAVNTFADAEVIETGNNRGWTVRATADHRWVARHNETHEPLWMTTADTRQHSWVVAAPLDDGVGVDVTDDEAELLGWLLTDGSQWESHEECAFLGCGNPARAKGLCGSHRRQQKRGVALRPLRSYPKPAAACFSMFVWQTKPAGVARLRSLLGDRAGWNGKGYRLNDAYARDLLDRADLTHIKDAGQLRALISRMTADQRRHMLDGVIGGDGTADGRRILQDAGPLCDVIALLAYHCGYRVRVVKRTLKGEWRNGSSGVPMSIQLAKQRVSTFRRERKPIGRMSVWCPTTELGTWTARFDGNPVLTGNSHAHWAMEQGGVFDKPTSGLFTFAETAKSRPEVVAPEPVLADTFARVLNERAGRDSPLIGELNNYTEADPLLFAAELAWRLP